MTISKLNIGVLGCANVAERLMIPAIKKSQGFNLFAVGSRNVQKAKDWGDRFDCLGVSYDELIACKKVDAIYISLPIGLHKEWCVKAFRANKHVICEKSLGPNLKDVETILNEAKLHKKVIFENFMFIYHRQMKLVHDLLQTGSIGELRQFRSSFGFPSLGFDNIRYKKELGGGSLLDAGAYTIKASLIFLRTNLKVLQADLKRLSIDGVDINGAVLLKNSENVHGFLSFGFDNFYQNKIEFWGTKGLLTMHRAFTAGPGITPLITLENQEGKKEFLVQEDNHFVNILDDFYNHIIRGDFTANQDELLTQAKIIDKVFAYDR